MKKYIAYYNNNVYYFDTWPECKEFIDDKLFVRYKKVSSEEEADLFIQSAKRGKKIYIAIDNNEAKVFDNWGACKNFVDGHPNCKYKSFTNEENAQDFINLNIKKKISLGLNDVLYCYVGGTYQNEPGFVMIKNNDVLYHSRYTDNGSKNTQGFQIWDELKSVTDGLQWAIMNDYEQIVIVYNNDGVENWANGTWSTKKEFTKEYKAKVKELSDRINIDFFHKE